MTPDRLDRLRWAAAVLHVCLIAAGLLALVPQYGDPAPGQLDRDLANMVWGTPFVLAGIVGLYAVAVDGPALERVALSIAAIGVAARIAMLSLMAFTAPYETAARCFILVLVLSQLAARWLRLSEPGYSRKDRARYGATQGVA